MKRSYAGLFVVVLAGCLTGFAQDATTKKLLNQKQLEGQRMFQQRCSICHTQPMIVSKPYGPMLNKETVTGREVSVRNTIMEGETGLMPGFKYGLSPAEISSIIEYLKTVEKPAHPIVNWVAEP